MNIIRYTINHTDLDQSKLLSPWKWLIGDDKEIVVVTKMGDMLLTDLSGKLYFLSITDGSMELISNYSSDFFKNRLPAEDYYEIFVPNIIEDLEKEEMLLSAGQIYAYVKLPIMGGENGIDNIHRVDIYQHFVLASTIHKELDEMPKPELN